MKKSFKLETNIYYYTIFITIIITAFIFSYFIFILPGIYNQNTKSRALKEVITINKKLSIDIEHLFKDEIAINYYFLKIDLAKDDIYFSNNYTGSYKVDIVDDKLIKMKNELVNILKQDKISQKDFDKIDLSYFKNYNSIKLNPLNKDRKSNSPTDNSSFIHSVNDINIIEYSSKSNNEIYVNYLSFYKKDDQIYIGMFPTLISQFNDLGASILNILPAILLFSIVIIIAFTKLFSNKITKPLDALMDNVSIINGNQDVIPLIEPSQISEFNILNNVLNELHRNLVDNIKKVSSQNQKLEEAKMNQEVFLIASSHQLKTPVAGCLLVVEGMLNNIGKYQDHQTYLKVVSKELNKINSIIYEIMDITNTDNFNDVETMNITDLIDNSLLINDSLIQNNKIRIIRQDQSYHINTNIKLLFKIIETIINNACKYTSNNKIIFNIDNGILSITNYGLNIDDSLLESIFQPFTRGNNSASNGHGLGLYIVATYSKQINTEVIIENINDGVRVSINLNEIHIIN